MSRLEVLLAATKRDYELLRIEHEKTISSNEQATPIAKLVRLSIFPKSLTDLVTRELKATVDILQKTIQQLKAEANRYKTRAHKAEQGNIKVSYSHHFEPFTFVHSLACSCSLIPPSPDIILHPHIQATEEKSGEDHIPVATGTTNETLSSAGEEYVRKLEGEKRDLESEISALKELGSEKLDEAALAEKRAQHQVFRCVVVYTPAKPAF